MLWVTSDTEIITLRTAWQEYQHIWNLFTSTGLCLIPFILCFIKSIAALYPSSTQKGALHSSLSKVELQFFAMCICVMCGAQPFVTLQLKPLYSDSVAIDQCNDLPFKVPLVWAGLMGVSSAFLQALSKAMGPEKNAREISVKVDMATIQNITLLLETQSFIQECYWPSIRRYFREEEKGEGSVNAQDAEIQAGSLWPGSDYFLTQTGYYDYFISSTHQTLAVSGSEGTEEASRLSCKVWWSDPYKGLKNRLITELRSHIPGLDQFVLDGDWQIFLKKLMHTTLRTGYKSSVSNQRAEEESSFSSLITRLVGHYGLAREALSFYPVMSVILEALPLFQALLLMGGIVLYPVWILLCNYNLQALSRYMMIWLSVQCWTYLWALSQHVDNVLIQTFYPGLSIDWAGKILIDMVALVMYIVLPLCCTASFFWIRR